MFRSRIILGAIAWHYVTGKRNLSETTPLYQLGDKVRIGIPEEQEVKYYDGNEYGTLGIKYLEKTTDSLTQSEIDRHDNTGTKIEANRDK